jgi:two-component system, OmpR family, response regulator MprA
MARILVADDSETILLLLRTRLEMEGYEVITAADGAEASEELWGRDPSEGPDLMLLDAMMPRKSGLDVLREVRDAGSQIPVLIVSAHGEAAAQARAPEAGASGFLEKPIDFNELLGRVAELLGERG